MRREFVGLLASNGPLVTGPPAEVGGGVLNAGFGTPGIISAGVAGIPPAGVAIVFIAPGVAE